MISVRAMYYALGVLILITLGSVVLITGKERPSYSVVYFDNSTLPSYLRVGVNSTVVFVIHSHESNLINYTFNVYLNGVLIKSGKVSLKPGQSVQIPVALLVKNVTYQRIVLQNTTTKYTLDGVTNITTLCVPLNSSTGNKWSCSPPLYKGPNGLSFVLNPTGNVSINQTVWSVKNDSPTITVTNIIILRNKPRGYIVTIRTVKWIEIKQDVNLKVIVRSSKGNIYMITHQFPVIGGG